MSFGKHSAARSPLFYAARAFALALLLVPPRHRVRVAAMLIRIGARTQRRREWLLERVISHLTAMDARFDVPMDVRGEDELFAALERGRGAVLITTHGKLHPLWIRHAHDVGLEPLLIAAYPEFAIPGTRIPANAILRSPACLVRVRTELRRGGVVMTMIDWSDDAGAIRFDTAVGEVAISDALIHVAHRSGSPLAFFTVHLDRSAKLVLDIHVQPASQSADASIAAFIAFVQREAEEWKHL